MYMWSRLVRTVDSSLDFITPDGRFATMQHNDQAAFARAIEMTGFNPFVLPFNWNFRPKWHRSFFGPLKIWHDQKPPVAEILDINDNQTRTDTVVAYTKLD